MNHPSSVMVRQQPMPAQSSSLAEIVASRQAGPVKISGAVQQMARAAAVRTDLVRAATLTINRVESELHAQLTVEANRQLDERSAAIAAASTLTDDLRQAAETVSHNLYLRQMNRANGLSDVFDDIHGDVVRQIMQMAPTDIEPETPGRVLWNVLNLYEPELKRKYDITMPFWKRLLNIPTFGLVALRELGEAERQRERERRYGQY